METAKAIARKTKTTYEEAKIAINEAITAQNALSTRDVTDAEKVDHPFWMFGDCVHVDAAEYDRLSEVITSAASVIRAHEGPVFFDGE